MNEEDKPISFEEYSEEQEEVIIDAEIPQYVGVCDKCLGSGYVIRERNGVMGVVFTSTNTDSEGRPIRRLVCCDCRAEVNF